MPRRNRKLAFCRTRNASPIAPDSYIHIPTRAYTQQWHAARRRCRRLRRRPSINKCAHAAPVVAADVTSRHVVQQTYNAHTGACKLPFSCATLCWVRLLCVCVNARAHRLPVRLRSIQWILLCRNRASEFCVGVGVYKHKCTMHTAALLYGNSKQVFKNAGFFCVFPDVFGQTSKFIIGYVSLEPTDSNPVIHSIYDPARWIPAPAAAVVMPTTCGQCASFGGCAFELPNGNKLATLRFQNGRPKVLILCASRRGRCDASTPKTPCFP